MTKEAEDLLSKHPVSTITADFVSLREKFPEDEKLKNYWMSFQGEVKVEYDIDVIRNQNEARSTMLKVPHYEFWTRLLQPYVNRMTRH